MKYYLYGDNIYASRLKLNEILAKFKERSSNLKIINISQKNYDEKTLLTSAKSTSLFEESKLFLVENLKFFRSKQQDFVLQFLKKYAQNIIIWDDNQTSLANKIKKFLPEINVLVFEQPKIIFKFLEQIYPGNQKVFLDLFFQLSKNQPTELIFFFLKKHFRNLLTAENPNTKLADWQKTKLLNQLNKLTKEKAISFYNKLLELEYDLKTGRLQTDLNLALVNLLLTL